jgi:hypothetical protein
MTTDAAICGQPEGFTGTLCREPRGLCPVHDAETPAFAAQRPDPNRASAQARASMIEAVATSITHLADRGLLILPDELPELAPKRAASVIVDDLMAHVLLQAMGGMAASEVQG